MKETSKKELEEKLEQYCYINGEMSYVMERIRIIRLELKKVDKIFETKNLAEVLNISDTSYHQMEKGEIGTSYKIVLLIINIFKLYGYNPSWIISKDNLFIPKKETNTDIIIENITVQKAVFNFSNKLKEIQNLQKDAQVLYKKAQSMQKEAIKNLEEQIK